MRPMRTARLTYHCARFILLAALVAPLACDDGDPATPPAAPAKGGDSGEAPDGAAGGAPSAATPAKADPAVVEPGFVKGRVTDAQGRPLAGAKVFADNTLYYNTNAIGVTDAEGYYRLDVSEPRGTWHMTAQLTRDFHDVRYRHDLHPDSDDPFAGSDGAIRNFTWKLAGKRHDGYAYGGQAYVYPYVEGEDVDFDAVELTFAPDGPMPDGSSMAPFTRKGTGQLDGIPVGRYAVTARYAPEGQPPRPLTVRMRFAKEYADKTTATFPAEPDGRVKLMEIEVGGEVGGRS